MGSKRKRTAKESVSNDTQPSKKRLKKASKSLNSSAPKKANTLDKSPFSENPTVQDRKRELELYELLGSEDGSERIVAADAIVSGLLGGDGVAQPVLERHLEKRLFRGLASGRNASRLGFSLVITEVINQLFGEKELANEKYPGLTFDKVLGMLVDKTQAGGNVPGQEERDRYFGQLFGIECFVRSGILFSDKRRWLSVLDMLLSLAQKKPWLKSQCGYVIVQAVLQMKKKLAEKTLEKLAEEGFAKTPEGVGIWIAALDQFPDMDVPAQPWRDPLAATSLSTLPSVLKESGREQQNEPNANSKIKQGSWSAQLHFVWDFILARFVKLAGKTPDAAAQFKQFWKRVVDEGFFSKTSSDHQKFSGFVIFQKLLQGVADYTEMVECLFSQNFMACLMNQAAREDRYLHRAALKALKAIECTVEKNPDLLPTVLRQLLSEHGVHNFDQRTNTKTVDKLLQNTTLQTVKPVIKLLKLKNPTRSGLDEDKYYQALGSYLFRLASTSEMDEGQSSKSVGGTAVELLAELAYSNKSVPAKLKEGLRAKCTAAFAKLARRPEDFGHLCGAILSIETEMSGDYDETAWSAMSRAYERLRELLDPAKASEGTKTQRQALALLHAVGILQFHNEDPDAVDLFDELEEFYSKIARDDVEEGEGVPEFMVEILLAMVARPSSLMRQVSQQVFDAFTSLMSPEALGLLTDPLAANESAKGQQALFSTEDEDMADANAADVDGSGEEELDSDVEMAKLEGAGSDGDEDSDKDSDGEDEDEDDEEGEDKDQEALDALDNALAEVLGSHRLDKDAEAESDEESDMTDSEMMEVDAKLAEIFKHRAKTTNKKKERKDAKETVINFKHRILDLLAIFVKKEAAVLNPLVFETLLPLLRLVRTTTSKALANKACEAIQNLSKALKKARSSHIENDSVDADKLMELLAEVHDEASKDPAHAFAKVASTTSLSVASVLCGIEDKRSEVFQLYAQTQMKCYEGKIKIQQAFFLDWLNWCQSHASTAAAQAS